ncbi:hypothetical protein TWF481_004937 [Arthrobotrys musiformis]|uniref:Fe2OG dioxygenase domain-containing protein n=1 Tax=Arthrobotrys musiformis TaxID=47236 RepID=A0AAV9WL09_9PEZI
MPSISISRQIKKLFLYEEKQKLGETARNVEGPKAQEPTPCIQPQNNITDPVISSSLTPGLEGSALPIIDYKDISQVPDVLTRFPAFYLTNHPLPPAPFHHARTLLGLPADVKDKLRDPGKSTVRGYSNAKASGREWWDYNPAENILGPPGNEEFAKDTPEFFKKSIEILQNICRQFNSVEELIPQEVIDEAGFSTMRYLRYSPDVIEQQPTHGGENSQSTYNSVLNSRRDGDDGQALPHIEAHTDLDILTLITATEPSGLYVWNRRGEVFSAPPMDGAVLVMAGDIMPFFTSKPGMSPLAQHEGLEAVGENTVLPTAHTVVVPRSAGERYSIAVFLRPRRDMVVDKRVVNRGGKEVVEETAFWWLATEKLHVEGRKCFLA